MTDKIRTKTSAKMIKRVLVRKGQIVYNGKEKRTLWKGSFKQMAKVFWKGSTLLAPVAPTMVSCGSEEKPNIITIAWTGIVNSNPPMTYISVRPSRYSYDIIKESGEFVINLTPSRLVRQADWCGVKSGRDVDKFKECHLTPGKANQISAPLIEECPINLECKVKNITPLGSHDMFIAEVMAVNVDESLLDEKGTLHLSDADLIAYSHGRYYGLGDFIGKFGYSVQKPSKTKSSRKKK